MIINKIKTAINKLNAKNSSFLPYLPFVIFFVILFIWHFMLHFSGDELYFSKLYYRNDIFNSILMRYVNWSSRFIIEFFLIPLAGLPRIVWNFLDSIIFTLIAVLITKLTLNTGKINRKKSFIYNSLSCILVSIYIFAISSALASAGNIATTLNYTWPLFFVLLHFYLIKKYSFNDTTEIANSTKISIYALMFFSLIFAINQELMLFIVAGAYFLIILYCLYNKITIPKSIFLMLFTLFLGFLNFYLCPGNHLRYSGEIRTWFPDYNTVTLINKIDLGISLLLNRIMLPNPLIKDNLINLIFFGVFAAYVYSITKKKISLLISLTPLIIILTLLIMFYIGYFPVIEFIHEGITKYGLLHSNITHIMLISVLYLIILISVLYGLINIYKYRGKKLCALILSLLLLGFASQMVKGFSPTCWATGERWEIYYYFFITCITYILTVELLENKHNNGKIIDW